MFQRNKYGLCPKCLETVLTVGWMFEVQLLEAMRPDRTALDAAGIVVAR